MSALPQYPEPLYLEPRTEPRLAALLRAGDFTRSLVDALGSPLGVVLPDQMADNAERFRAMYRKHRLGGQIWFAHKANRSCALMRRLAVTDAAVDVASVGELQQALGSGFTPDRIMATGPKSPEFLWLAARTGVTVHVDGRTELDDLAELVRSYALPRVRILLRLSAFGTSGVKVLSRTSRFGTPVAELGGLVRAVERHGDAVELLGVGFHLDTTSVAEKAVALEGCVRALDTLRERGLRPRVVDIGGGYGVNYLAHQEQWERYTTELTRAVLGRRPPLTWRGHGYGLRDEAGTLRGSLALYPGYRPVAAERYLDELLSVPAPSFGGRTLSTVLLENLYDLYTEPGRALADQCGLTLARVLDVRRTEAGEHLVRLAAKADDIGLEDHGIVMDPVVIGRDGGSVTDSGDAVGVYLAGSLCLEADLISRRMVFLPRLPSPGDLLGFVNTAGYCMDFQASRAQLLPVGRKVAAWRDGDGSWRWSLDEQYWPTLCQEGRA
ncbi:Y4yA family PLP-dependent enzyme [Streptomyces lushanensis]|uniref:Y4yA family PLP-dependent enzyme n=1 Tax=Streptomyces lushanensis TaxID=1434255 RepID=UPI00082ECAC4|nr:Y4yA family PLP-dependent enzyme [Streptomyces lushanensis]